MILQGLHPPRRDGRRLTIALAASAAVHALVLAVGMHEPVIRAWPTPLRAELRALPVPEAAEPRERPRSRLVRGVPPAPTPVQRAKAPDPARPSALPSAQVPVLSTASPAAEAVPVREQASAAMPASVAAPAAPRESAVTAARVDAHEDGLDADALREYRYALARAATRSYPPIAVRQGLSGTAEVRLTVAAGGAQRAVAIKRSSGHRVLDLEAQAMISAAAERAAVPAGLRGQEFALDLPVRFELREASD